MQQVRLYKAKMLHWKNVLQRMQKERLQTSCTKKYFAKYQYFARGVCAFKAQVCFQEQRPWYHCILHILWLTRKYTEKRSANSAAAA